MRAHLTFIGVLAGCGLGGGTGGGADNLPTQGAGPFRVPAADFDTPADEPYILASPLLSLTEPCGVPRAGGGFVVMFGQASDAGDDEIWRAEFSSTSELVLVPPERVLGADADWEQGFVGEPSLVQDGDELVLYYRGGVDAPAIGRAVSQDGGKTFSKDPRNPILQGFVTPSAARAHDRWILAAASTDGSAIVWTESEDGASFDAPRVVAEPRADVAGAFDELAVRSPFLTVRETVVDDGQHFGLFVTGESPGADEGEVVENVGYLGSFDGEQWERFLSGMPVVDPGPQGAGGPASVRLGHEVLLLFHQYRAGRGRIAAGVSQ